MLLEHRSVRKIILVDLSVGRLTHRSAANRKRSPMMSAEMPWNMLDLHQCKDLAASSGWLLSDAVLEEVATNMLLLARHHDTACSALAERAK
jgi:hypothetical protein